jgi:hypothetical protein
MTTAIFSQVAPPDSSQIKANFTSSLESASKKASEITTEKIADNLPEIISRAKGLKDNKALLVDSTISDLKKNEVTNVSKSLLQKLFYQMALNFDVSRGNQNYANIIPQLDFGIENKLVGFNTQTLYNFARLNGQQLNSDLIARNALTLLPQSKLPVQLLGSGESSKIRQLPSRYQTGLGVSFKILKKENHSIRGGINGVYDRSNYSGNLFKNDPEQTTNIRTVFGPLLQLMGHHTLKEGRIALTYTVSTLQALNHKKDYRVNAISTLSFPVFKGISLRSSLIYSKESVILRDTKHSDLFVTFGLGLGQF